MNINLMQKKIQIQIRCLFLNDIDYKFTKLEFNQLNLFYLEYFDANDTVNTVMEKIFENLMYNKLIKYSDSKYIIL